MYMCIVCVCVSMLCEYVICVGVRIYVNVCVQCRCVGVTKYVGMLYVDVCRYERMCL